MLRSTSDLPVRVVEKGWRLHLRGNHAEYYFRGPTRFVPEQSGVGTLFLTEEFEGAIAEFSHGFSSVSVSTLGEYALTELRFHSQLQIADATSLDFPISIADLLSVDYSTSQAVATELYGNGFHGVAFQGVAGVVIFAVFGNQGIGKESESGPETPISPAVLRKLSVSIAADGEGGILQAVET